ncbi:hypothetical protein EG68_07828 [Paragonimus skrjabini miyazakii]|uniref:Uncharacterized protein n=1 Tax=Paragonimus skrjabini miyazakii TaxID=59628 RepID=A0A8S9YQ67_9TREM|nr:hypothetical protein EG68_07828 [Paragonimus skrjabini miyazakii]
MCTQRNVTCTLKAWRSRSALTQSTAMPTINPLTPEIFAVRMQQPTMLTKQVLFIVFEFCVPTWNFSFTQTGSG